MEEQHGWCNFLSVRKSRPGLSPLDFQSPSLPPFPPSAKDVHVSVQTLARSDLWLCGYRKRIKRIACMCSLFIANTNEKWAHPLPLGFSLLSHFLSPYTTTSPFLTVKHLERVTVTTQPQESKCLPLRTMLIWRRRCQRGPQWVSITYCSLTESTKYCWIFHCDSIVCELL